MKLSVVQGVGVAQGVRSRTGSDPLHNVPNRSYEASLLPRTFLLHLPQSIDYSEFSAASSSLSLLPLRQSPIL